MIVDRGVGVGKLSDGLHVPELCHLPLGFFPGRQENRETKGQTKIRQPKTLGGENLPKDGVGQARGTDACIPLARF